MWRFLVADDPEVTRFLIRAADSLLSEREQMAVQAWTESLYWFHHLRDYFTHTELILAGLWGGCRGVLPPLKPLMVHWLARQRDLTRFADQIFLREEVWPLLRQSVLNHDEIFGFHDARPFPAHPPDSMEHRPLQWEAMRASRAFKAQARRRTANGSPGQCWTSRAKRSASTVRRFAGATMRNSKSSKVCVKIESMVSLRKGAPL
ncbi:MAG TPA: hypothetical protein VLJ19_04840 [Variovorax sp.]|nr:hypothetical protein [Variovorax sp.]